MGYPIKQSQTAQPLVFLLVLSSDHITGATGLSPTVTLSKSGASFASPSGAVAEIGNGWYKVAGNATDSGTLGPLLLHATVATADPCDDRFDVVAYDPQSATNLGLSALPTANPAAAGGLPTVDASNGVKLSVGTGTGQLNLAAGKAPATLAATDVTGNLPADLQTIKTQTITCAAGVTVGAFVGNTTAALSVDASGRVDLGKILGTASAGAAGYAGIDWGHVNAPTTAVNLSGTTISTTQAVASVTGAVGSISGVTFPANFSALAISLGGIASADVQTIKTQAVTCAAGVTVLASVGTASTSTAQTGDSFARIGAAGVGLTNLGDTRIANLDATVSSRLAPTVAGHTLDVSVTGEAGLDWANIGAPTTTVNLSGTTISTSQAVASVSGAVGSVTGNVGGNLTGTIGGYASGQDPATLVLDATAASHNTAGTIGQKINSAASAGDPWTTSLPGTYSAGQAGFIVGTNLNATVGSRSTYAGGDTSGTTTLLTRIPGTVQPQTGDAFARLGLAGAGLTAIGDTRLANLDAAISSRSTYAGGAVASVTGNVGGSVASVAGNVGGNVTGSVGSVATGGIVTTTFAAGTTLPRVTLVDTCTANTDMRGTNNALLASSYTAPDNATIGTTSTAVAAVKAKTDQLTFTVTGHVDATASIGGNVTVGGYASGQDPATLVLDATATAHNTSGTVGNKINSAASAGDPWSTAEPGSYASGTFGYLVSHALATPTTPVAINQDYLGTGRLTVENPPGNPIAGAAVTAYLAADYAASGASASPVATTTTDAAGRWTLTLAPAQYTVAFAFAGQRTTSTFYVR